MSVNGKTRSRATGSRLAGTRITGKLGKCGRGTRKTEEGEGKKEIQADVDKATVVTRRNKSGSGGGWRNKT